MSKKQPKLTPWFVNGEKPARPGLYEVKARGPRPYWPMYAYYTKSSGWGCGRQTKEQALIDKDKVAVRDYYSRNGRWRGLAEKP